MSRRSHRDRDIEWTLPLLPAEIDLPNLVFEAGAVLQRGAEICPAEDKSVRVLDCAHRRVARLVGEQRSFAEDFAGAKDGKLALRLAKLLCRYGSGAAGNEKELVTDISLPDHDLTSGTAALLHAFGHVSNLGRREAFEDFDGLQELTDHEHIAHDHI